MPVMVATEHRQPAGANHGRDNRFRHAQTPTVGNRGRHVSILQQQSMQLADRPGPTVLQAIEAATQDITHKVGYR